MSKRSLFAPHNTIEVGEIAVAYRRRGAGEPLLYLHGAGMVDRWLPLYDELAKSHDVIVPEHPGFGATPRPDTFDGSRLAAHYLSLLAKLELDRVHVVGHSFGGRVAARFASDAPDRVISLCLITPGPPEPVPPVEWPSRTAQETIAALFNDQSAGFEAYIDEGSADATADRLDQERSAAAGLANVLHDDEKLRERLARVVAPTLVVEPDEDRVIPQAVFRRYAQLIPNARLTKLSGARMPSAHALIAQEPQRLAALIIDFAAAADDAEQAPRPTA